MQHPLTIGKAKDGSLVQLPIDSLRRHMLALGASGSGKTVLSKVVIEECIRKGLPVIAIDPQGDLASMALAEDDATLIKMGVDPAIAAQFRAKVEVKIWTPGSTAGIPLSFTPAMEIPTGISSEDKIRAFGSVGNALAAMIGASDESTAIAFSIILEYADANNLACESIPDFINFLADPPMPLAVQLNPIFSAKDRAKSHKAFALKTLGSNRLLFDLGRSIDINELFGLRNNNGKTRLSIIYLNTLTSQEDKEIFISLLCSAMYQWMLSMDGSKLWGMLAIDEIAAYLPPVKNTPCKQGLMLLLRQARKYGLCCLLATQSPGDIDYKALGQVSTIALGKITGERAIGKVAPLIRAVPGIDADAIIDALPSMTKGKFVVINPDVWTVPQSVSVRWLVTKHSTVSSDALADLVTDDDRRIFG
jgi:DNA helicase HerA-like ATPase